MPDTLGIVELLTRIGEDNVRVQNIVENLTNIRLAKKNKETVLTIVTSPEFITPDSVFHNTPQFVGLISYGCRRI